MQFLGRRSLLLAITVSSNQTGTMGALRFLGQAKVVGPGGDVVARTHGKGGMAIANMDVEAEVTRSRRTLDHLRERVPSAYARAQGAVT